MAGLPTHFAIAHTVMPGGNSGHKLVTPIVYGRPMGAQPSQMFHDSDIQDEELRRDLDSLYVLPLRILPLRSAALQRARMIKDSRLDSAIQIFSDKMTGSGLVYLDDLKASALGMTKEAFKADQAILGNVGCLHSFDVYSLRICLRELDIEVTSESYLHLSDEMKAQLKDYMTAFTLPLIKQVYGTVAVDIEDADDIIKLFSDPDVEVALEKLRRLSSVLNIELHDIPAFLEDFSDIYLSLAYYQKYLDQITPMISSFVDELRMLRSNWQLRQDDRLMDTLDRLEKELGDLTASVTGRFAAFNRNTEQMWENITAERFRTVESLIKSHHATVGAILCGIGSKMNAWRSFYRDAGAGGPVGRSEVIMSDIVPGLDKILKIDQATPLVVDA